MSDLTKIIAAMKKDVGQCIETMEGVATDTREALISQGKGKLGIRFKLTKNGAAVEWYLRVVKKIGGKNQVRSEFLKKGNRTQYNPQHIAGRVTKDEFEIFCLVETEIGLQREKLWSLQKAIKELQRTEKRIMDGLGIDPGLEWSRHLEFKRAKEERAARENA